MEILQGVGQSVQSEGREQTPQDSPSDIGHKFGGPRAILTSDQQAAHSGFPTATPKFENSVE